jgi:hypothetical protein
MKINSVQRDMTLKQSGSTLHQDFPIYKEKNGADMYDRGYNANYCGSFTGKSKSATTFLDKILSSSWFGKFTKYSYEHNISTSALIALVLAGIMRPATIMALPGKDDKEDKIYASGHAMASGIIGFLVSTAVTSPFDESIKKVFDQKKFARGKFKEMDEKIAELNLKKEAKTLTDEAKKELKALTKKREALNVLVKNIPDWLIGVPRAMLTIALIPPILKYVFGLEKKKKTTPAPQEQTQVAQAPRMDFIDKDVFKNVKGGVQ